MLHFHYHIRLFQDCCIADRIGITGTAGAREASGHNERENSSNNNTSARVSYKHILVTDCLGVGTDTALCALSVVMIYFMCSPFRLTSS